MLKNNWSCRHCWQT